MLFSISLHEATERRHIALLNSKWSDDFTLYWSVLLDSKFVAPYKVLLVLLLTVRIYFCPQLRRHIFVSTMTDPYVLGAICRKLY